MTKLLIYNEGDTNTSFLAGVHVDGLVNFSEAKDTQDWSTQAGIDADQSDFEWVCSVWQPFVAAGNDLILSIPMLPKLQAHQLYQGAHHQWDPVWTGYAGLMVRYGLTNITIRPGWEMNGNWYPWNAFTDTSDYITYWQNIVTILRAGGFTGKVFWCPASGYQPDASQVYPGDAWVDVVGLDLYNQASGFYGALHDGNSLTWLAGFAQSHSKPIMLGEWGTSADDPEFITGVHDWLVTNNALAAAYWNAAAWSGYDGILTDGRRPLAAAAFIAAFGATVVPIVGSFADYQISDGGLAVPTAPQIGGELNIPDVPLRISGAPPPTGVVGTPYSFTPTVTGGVLPYSFSLNDPGGAILGVTLSTSGIFAGTPTAPVNFSGSITVTDAHGTTSTLGPFTVVISAAPVVPQGFSAVIARSGVASSVPLSSLTS